MNQITIHNDSTGHAPLMNEEEEALMDAVMVVDSTDPSNKTEDTVLLVEAEDDTAALQTAENWIDLCATLDGSIKIGQEPTIEPIKENTEDVMRENMFNDYQTVKLVE